MQTPRESPTPTPEICDSPVPRRAKEIRPPTNIVSRSAPAAPSAPPGGRPGAPGGDAGPEGQVREMLQVQGNSLKLLNEVFDFPVTEDASVSILDQYPELAWLAHCMQRCPLPPCWTSVEGEGEARYIDMETGDMTEIQPLLKNFAEMARLMLEWRQAPSAAPHVATELKSRHDHAVEDAARSRRVWSGPHVDPTTSMKFWHCEATGRSTWGDPGAASEFMARVAQRLSKALPAPAEDASPFAAPSATAAPSQAPLCPQSSSNPEKGEADSAIEPRPTILAPKTLEKVDAPAQSPRPNTPQDRAVKQSPRPNTPQDRAAKQCPRPNTPQDKTIQQSPRPNTPQDRAGTDSQAPPANKLGDTGEMIKDRAAEVREMMAKIRKECQPLAQTISRDALKEELAPKAPSCPDVPSPARTGRSPRLPTSARGPSPRQSPPLRVPPSPRSLASARGAKCAQQPVPLTEWGVPGNRIYKEAAAEVAVAEVRAPVAGMFNPGACRPSPGRRPSVSIERLQPMSSPSAPSPSEVTEAAFKVIRASAPSPRSKSKQVTILDSDGVTTVRPGEADDNVLFIEGSGARPDVGDISDACKELSKELNKVPLAPRCSTPGRPRTRHGDLDDEMKPLATPRPGTPSKQTPRSSSRPSTPMKKNLSDKADADVAVTTPTRTAQAYQTSHAADDDMSSSSSEDSAAQVDLSSDSPGLGNTGAARELCDMAVAAAVDLAFGSEPVEQTREDPGSPDSLEGALPPSAAEEIFRNTLNTLNNELGNTAAAQQLCDDAISAAVGSAVTAVALNCTAGSVDGCQSLCGTFGGTGVRSLAGATMGESMGYGRTLGATGDVPPVLPGEGMMETLDMRGDDEDAGSPLPTTPVPQGTATFLRRALGACTEEDEEGEPLSPTLMSICRSSSQSPTKRHLNSSFGDSPSIIFVDDTHWTPCKPLSRQLSPAPSYSNDEEMPPMCSPSPCSPPAPRSKRKAQKERPVRCLSPTPLSARGRERHVQEMAEFGQSKAWAEERKWKPVVGPMSARGMRPQGRGRHVAMSGGA